MRYTIALSIVFISSLQAANNNLELHKAAIEKKEKVKITALTLFSLDERKSILAGTKKGNVLEFLLSKDDNLQERYYCNPHNNSDRGTEEDPGAVKKIETTGNKITIMYAKKIIDKYFVEDYARIKIPGQRSYHNKLSGIWRWENKDYWENPA